MEIVVSIGFRNSYNKSISAGFCAGSRVIVCSNLMFTGDIVRIRRHTRNILTDIDVIIKEIISYGEKNATQLKNDMEEEEQYFCIFRLCLIFNKNQFKELIVKNPFAREMYYISKKIN